MGISTVDTRPNSRSLPQKHTEPSRNWAPMGRMVEYSPGSPTPWGGPAELPQASLTSGEPWGSKQRHKYVWNQTEWAGSETESWFWTAQPSHSWTQRGQWESESRSQVCLPPRGDAAAGDTADTAGSRTETGAQVPKPCPSCHTRACETFHCSLLRSTAASPMPGLQLSYGNDRNKLLGHEVNWNGTTHGAKARGSFPFFWHPTMKKQPSAPGRDIPGLSAAGLL